MRKSMSFSWIRQLEFKLGGPWVTFNRRSRDDGRYVQYAISKVKELHVTLEYAKEKFEKSDVNRLQVA